MVSEFSEAASTLETGTGRRLALEPIRGLAGLRGTEGARADVILSLCHVRGPFSGTAFVTIASSKRSHSTAEPDGEPHGIVYDTEALDRRIPVIRQVLASRMGSGAACERLPGNLVRLCRG
jgi:hypothetical protein